MLEKIKSGLAWTAGSRLGITLINLLVLAVTARLISPAGFGLYAIALVFINFVIILSEGAFGAALVQRKQVTEAHISAALGGTLLLSLVATAVIAASAYPVSIAFKAPEVLYFLLLLVTIVPLKMIKGLLTSLLQRDCQFKAISTAAIYSQLFGYMGPAIILALLDFGPWALLIGNMLAALIEYLLIRRAMGRKLTASFDVVSMKDLWGFSAYFTLTKVSNYGALNLDNMIIGKMLGMSALGIYSRAFSLYQMPCNLIGGVVHKTFFPVLSSVQDQPEKFRKIIGDMMGAIIPVAMYISVSTAYLSDVVVKWLLGAQWDVAAEVLLVLSLSIFAKCGYAITETAVFSLGKSSRSMQLQFIYMLLVGITATVGALFGIEYVALGVSLSVVAFYALSMRALAGMTGLNVPAAVRVHLKSALFCSAVAATAHFTTDLVPAGGEVIKIVIYALSSLLLGLACVAAGWMNLSSYARLLKKRGPSK